MPQQNLNDIISIRSVRKTHYLDRYLIDFHIVLIELSYILVKSILLIYTRSQKIKVLSASRKS